MAGTLIAMYIKTKDKKKRGALASAIISSFCGVTEPALYGFALPERKPLAATCIAGGICGGLMMAFDVVMYTMGAMGIFGFTSYISPDGDVRGVVIAVGVSVAALALGFVIHTGACY